jgi:poly(A) polymerase Pap1
MRDPHDALEAIREQLSIEKVYLPLFKIKIIKVPVDMVFVTLGTIWGFIGGLALSVVFHAH